MTHLRHILFLLTLLLATALPAQVSTPFLDLDAADYPLTADALPRFTVQLQADSLSLSRGFDVQVEYPEFAPLTRRERALLHRHGFQPVETPEVEHYVSRSRGAEYVDVALTPIVRRQGRWLRITSVRVSLQPRPLTVAAALKAQPRAAADVAQRYAAASVLASGKWVKIRVPSEGVYQLTDSQLREWGFTSPESVRLFGYGGLPQGEVLGTADDLTPDDLEEVPLYRRSGAALFFAEGTVRWTYDASQYASDGLLRWKRQQNPYSDYSYYFLTEGGTPLAMPAAEVVTAQPQQTLTSVTGRTLYEDDSFFWYEGGREAHDSYDFQTGNQHAFRVDAPGIAAPEGLAEIVFSASSTLSATTATITLSGQSVGSLSVTAYNSETESARESRATFNVSNLTAENNFTFRSTQGHAARLNYITLNYLRTLSASATPWAFVPYAAGDAVTLQASGADSSTQLWRIGSKGQPTAAVATTLSGSTLSATVVPTLRYALVNTAASYPAPEKVADVENQNLHGDAAQDMVIIVPASGKLTAQAERIAEAHRAEGLRVRLVRTDQLYNEFSSGTPDATAYRRYLKMLYDRAASEADMPRYLLLFGDCAYDNRMRSVDWKGKSPADYLLAYEVSPSGTMNVPIGTLGSYVSDDYFALLDDGEGASIVREKPDVSVGRFPVSTEAEAKVLTDKTISYIQNKAVGAWKNRVVILSDNGMKGENNMHMKSSEKVAAAIAAATADRLHQKKVYWDAYTYTTSATGNTFPQVTKMLREDMKRGALMFNYMGHGSPQKVSHCSLLETPDYALPTDGNMPLWVFASCEITPFDRPANNIGRAALQNAEGGAVAVMCASRSVYANYNETLNINFCRYLFQDDSAAGNTVGDALRLAKVALVTDGGDRSMNKLKYVLLGDPALRLTAPTGRVVIDSIQGAPLQTSSDVQLRAGEKVRFSGYVATVDGSIDGSYTGLVSATLFDRLETITCKNNGGVADAPMVYQDRTKSLYEGSDSVRAGRFTINLTVPRDISYSTDAGRLVLYAVNADHSREAHGLCEQFHLNGMAQAEQPDTIGPRIYLYLNSPEFPDGGFTLPDARLIATVSDSSGINTSGISVGHDMEMWMDGQTAYPTTLNDYFTYDFGSSTSGTISYPLTGLSLGRHTLSLRAWDVCDNATTVTLSFNVTDQLQTGYDIHATENPASTRTTFITQLEANDPEASVTTQVFDVAGRLVWSSSGAPQGGAYYAATWNLCDAGGHPVGSGIYLYRSLIESGSGTHKLKSKKIIVVRQ